MSTIMPMRADTDINTDAKMQTSLQALITALQGAAVPAGSALVVYRGERCVVDACIGDANPDTPWSADTLSLNYSTGKGVLAALTHVLVSRGILAFDKPIAEYWPEFAANGKSEVTLRMVMSHQAGLYDIAALIEDEQDILSWAGMLQRVAAMAIADPVPLSSAARRLLRQYATQSARSTSDGDAHATAGYQNRHGQSGYHQSGCYQSVYSALVYGWVVGGLIERATKLSLADVLRQYLTEPLGIADACYFGVAASQLSRVARPVSHWQEQTSSAISNTSRLGALSKQQSLELIDGQIAGDGLTSVFPSLSVYDCWRQRADELGVKYDQSAGMGSAQINRLYFDPKLMDLRAYKAVLSMPNKAIIDYHSPAVLQACIPAANVVASARALAIIYAMLANGGQWQGQQFIDAATFKQLSTVQVEGMDAVMAQAANAPPAVPSMHWRLGYHRLLSVCHEHGVSQHAFGHMGYNGSVAWCDPSKRLAVAFVHNYPVTMFTDVRQFAVTEMLLDR